MTAHCKSMHCCTKLTCILQVLTINYNILNGLQMFSSYSSKAFKMLLISIKKCDGSK